MVFAEEQSAINEAWKQKKKPLDPVRQRKKHFCPKCGKLGFHVKMDYIKNIHLQGMTCMYNVDLYSCPKCGFKDKEHSRMEGTGKTGVNVGKMWGSK